MSVSSQKARRQLGPEEIALGQRSWRQHRFSSSKQNKTEGLTVVEELAELEKEEGAVPIET